MCLYEPTVFSTLMYNYEEVLEALAPYAGGTVAAVFCGHNHGGSVGRDGAGIPHFTLPSPLIFPQGSHLVVDVFEGRLGLRASGECAAQRIQQRIDMKQRQYRQQPFIRLHVQALDKAFAGQGEIALAVHHALGKAGRTRGVDEQAGVVGLAGSDCLKVFSQVLWQ